MNREQAGDKGGPWAVVVDLFPAWVTPNQLTVLRLALSLGILALELAGGSLGPMVALGLVAAFSDLLDGALARRRHLESRLGAALDPLGDKVFALVLAVVIWRRELAPQGLLLALLLTELHTVLIPSLVLAGRLRRGQGLGRLPRVTPNRWGKLKTGCLAGGLGFVVIGTWLAQGWLVSLALAVVVVGLGLGLVAEYLYFRDWWAGAWR